MDLKALIFSLLFSLSVGTFASFALVRPAAVGRKYFRYHGPLTAGLAALALVAVRPVGLLGPGLVFVLAASLYSKFQGAQARWAWAAYGGGLTAGVMGLAALTRNPLALASLFSSSALLGLTMSAMLLGHWYLNVPGLSIDELKRTVKACFVSLVVRVLVAAVGVLPFLVSPHEDPTRFFLSATGIFVMMRWAWGLIAPLGLAYFIWDTVRLRSTQSATGMLYVAVVVVLIGETIAQYLVFSQGLPA